ncbi:Uncharacterised protein [Bordetella pertussis]|nr:Uncharacterised protein [Bordetella pertussis]CFL80565.1 Uncharacterised protein [Bordetella pertussis]CFM12269.1 Uncharacterised protein [Bordetella pertussis]CFN23013.1 Uncharacterised protein [Bordetella pertussis]CFN44921.1 Uncharacterised protein [Bordetella pertussis]
MRRKAPVQSWHAAGQRDHGAAAARRGGVRAARPRGCSARCTDPGAGNRHRPEDRLRAGRRRPGRPVAVQDRPGALPGRLRPGHRAAQAGAGRPVQRQAAGRALRAAGQGQCRQQAGIRQRRGPLPAGRRQRGGGQGQPDQCQDQPGLYRRDLAHQGAHRQAAGDRGRAGRGDLGHPDGDGAAARPDLCRLHAIHRRPGGAPRVRRRQAAAGGQGRGQGPGGAGRRLDLPRSGQAAVYRRDGGSDHRAGEPAGRGAQSRQHPAARHVRARAGGPGRRRQGAAGAAAGPAAHRRRHAEPDAGQGQQGRAGAGDHGQRDPQPVGH